MARAGFARDVEIGDTLNITQKNAKRRNPGFVHFLDVEAPMDLDLTLSLTKGTESDRQPSPL